MNLQIKILNNNIEDAYLNHGNYHEGDIGLDLFCPDVLVIEPGETIKVKLGIACQTVENIGYMLVPRSSISKTPLRLANSIGIIDAGYRGELIAVVDNIKNEPYVIEKGSRLFQIVSFTGKPIKFEVVNELTETTRGSGGFGSTNNNENNNIENNALNLV